MAPEALARMSSLRALIDPLAVGRTAEELISEARSRCSRVSSEALIYGDERPLILRLPPLDPQIGKLESAALDEATKCDWLVQHEMARHRSHRHRRQCIAADTVNRP